jgi:alcohol dehydrogenase class IV
VVLGPTGDLMERHAAGSRPGVREFHASQPTDIVVGSGLVERSGSYVASFGARALIVVGESSARASGLLARVEASLRDQGVAFELLEGVGPNPGVAGVDAGATLARACRAEVVVGLGGGSVIDVAKAIATSAAAHEPRTFADHLSGRRAPDLLVDAALPIVALPTLPGSGSETNGTSVITDLETGRKLSAHSDLAAPRVALIDPDLLLDAPRALVAPGLVDAWCHALEAALSERATPASDALAEQALRVLSRHGADPLDETLDAPARLDAIVRTWLATNHAGQALTLAGSIVTHPLAHPLSARLDARHGEAVAALEAAVLATFADRFVASPAISRVATWLDARGSEHRAAALRSVLTRFARYCGALDIRSGVADLGLDEAMLADVVRDARASGSRGLTNLPGEEPTADELFAVLDVALECGPTTATRKLLAAAAKRLAPSS